MTGLLFQPRSLHEHLTLVVQVAIVLIGFVPDVRFAGFGANCDVRSRCFIMGAALVFALLGHTTLRMCHDLFNYQLLFSIRPRENYHLHWGYPFQVVD